MWLRRFIKFEVKRVLGRRYLTVALVFFLVSCYFIQYGISQYKNILKEKSNFQYCEETKIKQVVYISQVGFYGARLLFIPSPLMAFFDGGPVPNYMTVFFDSSERVLFYQPLRGQNAFARLNNLFMNFVGFLLLFGSGLILLYGFSGSGHEWLKLLEGWAGGRIKLFLYQLISKTFILLLFCLALAGLSLLLFIIKVVAVNPGQVLIICLTAFIMLLCFLVGGMIASTLIREKVPGKRIFWHEKGFTKNKENVIFFLTYVSYIRDIPLDQLKKTLEECNIEGGDFMPSLAQRLLDEGKEKGIKEEKRETARRMLSADFPIEDIVKFTGLTEQEVKELMN